MPWGAQVHVLRARGLRRPTLDQVFALTILGLAALLGLLFVRIDQSSRDALIERQPEPLEHAVVEAVAAQIRSQVRVRTNRAPNAG